MTRLGTNRLALLLNQRASNREDAGCFVSVMALCGT